MTGLDVDGQEPLEWLDQAAMIASSFNTHKVRQIRSAGLSSLFPLHPLESWDRRVVAGGNANPAAST
jgi:hypothetical protein